MGDQTMDDQAKEADPVQGGISQGGISQGQVMVVQTTADDRARLESLALLLTERRLAACVQVSGPLTSRYEWEGQSTVSQEWLLLAKTSPEGLGGVIAAIGEAHPYQLPEIIWQSVAATAAYAAWVRGQVATA